MLARRVPNARISVFQFQSQWFGKGAVDQRLENVADQLLYQLERLRGDNSKTPIIFVSHCLGGIVLERALLTSRLRQNDFPSIFPSVAGCIFLGTPFHGTKTLSKATVLAEMAATIGMGVSSSLLKLLEKDSEVLTRMLDEFVRLTNDAQIRVFCFFESEKSDLAAVILKGLPFKTQELVVDKESATYPGVESLQLASDHFKLNKYTGPKDGNFVSVSNEIKATAAKAAGIIKSRQNTVRQALINDRTYHALIDTLGRGFSDLSATTKGSYTGPKGDSPSWVVEVESFKQWKEQDASQLIWVHGKAGTGQGSIASSVIESLNKTKESGSIVASFFCDQSDESRRSLRSMLKLLIRQIIDANQDLAVHLLTDSKKTKNAGKQDYDPEALNKIPVLWEALQSMAKEVLGGCIHVVLYGIDQLSGESLEQFLQYMKEMPDKGAPRDEDFEVSPIKWMLLSRSGRPDIEKTFKAKAHEINIDDSENAEHVSDALRSTISVRVDDLGLSAPLTYFVKRHIHSRAEDNYIYVSLAIQEVKNAQSSGMYKHSEIRALLESFPFGLTDMFEHIRKRILSPAAEGIEYTKEILRCLILARRAPTLRELAIMADLPEEDREDLEALKGHLIRCGAFVTLRGNELDEDSMVAEWIDISAQEHLEKYAEKELALDTEQKQMQHGIIALRCLEYVYAVTEKYEEAEAAKHVIEEDADGDDGDGDQHSDANSEDADHQDELDVPNTVDKEKGEDEDKGEDDNHGNDDADAPNTEIAPTEADNDEGEHEFGKEDALHYPVQYWLEHAKLAEVDVIEEFRTHHPFWKDESPARQDWWSVNDSMHILPNQTNVTPLHVATIAEFPAFVDHLLNHGWTEDVHKEDSLGLQPLFCACAVGNYEIVETLLGVGADIDFVSHESNVTALYAAAERGHIDVVECLLDRDADINAKSAEWGSVL
ncbi:ankyrin [Lentithecium fluviatile CBS 122367]|uniref:Ankyrin n=1 Tax=Lentithecium fluviatile CBS 122367 TaxID=1168545 RepID=A0A6G1IHD2_9PLEO|nr:ankyrin [Lentithecium fluviatile CBS 122367]